MLLATAVTGCATGTGGIEPQDSHAIFSSFSYMGNDDFYAANPPAGESSYYNPILPDGIPIPPSAPMTRATTIW